MDQYVLVLEATQDSLQVRAIAINPATQSTVKTHLSPDQVRDLLTRAYGGEQTIVQSCIEQLNAAHTLEVLCVFAPNELMQVGFAPEELEV
jgi:hypothetical protein